MTGWAGNYVVGKVGGRWKGALLGQVRSPGFEVNDIGYQRDADGITNVLWLGHQEFRPGKLFRNYGRNFNGWNGINFGGDRLSTGANVNGYGQLRNYWNVWAGMNRNFSGMDTRALRGGPAILTPGAWNAWSGVGTDSRKPVMASLNASGNVRDEDAGWSYNLSTSVRWRPSASSTLSVAPFFSANHNGWQYVGQPQDGEGSRHYLFAELDQRTLGSSFRLNQTFTPNLSLQMYAQPFVSTGRYDGFKTAVAPRASRFADRFEHHGEGALTRGENQHALDLTGDGAPDVRFGNPDFSVRDLNLNAVLRWEYRLGSTIFFVWSHGRSAFDRSGALQPRQDVGALFDAPSRNVLMIKANYWLSL
jgi:hypothetical protein